MYLFRNHGTTKDGSGTGQPGKYFDINIYNRVLIFSQNVIKIAVLTSLQRMRVRTKVFSEWFVVSKERFGWVIRLCLHTFVAHVAVYSSYTYTNECVSEPLMRTLTDGI